MMPYRWMAVRGSLPVNTHKIIWIHAVYLLIRWLQALKTKQLQFARCFLYILTNTETNTFGIFEWGITQETWNPYFSEISLSCRFTYQFKLFRLKALTEKIIIPNLR